MPRRLVPYLFLTAFGLAYFGDLVLHPTRVLYSGKSDLLAMHLPMKRFLVRAWHETGELPLWNPYSFAGMPFVHDVQVAMFYPLHWPLLLLPESAVGAAVSWLVVLHVLVAGWGMYAYAGTQGLGTEARFVAALGFMLGGKAMLHVLGAGHTIVAPLAWLPLVLLFHEQGVRRASFLHATTAGGVFALIVLGAHPQITFYAGLFLALWTLGPALAAEPTSKGRALARWLLVGGWVAVVAVGLSAVQLLPALEATPETTRAAGVATSSLLRDVLPTLLRLVGPGLGDLYWESQGRFGVLWIAVAVAAPLLQPRVRFQAWVTILLVVFALGGAALLQGLPGFRLFQLPARMLLVATLPVALLAGVTMQTLLDLPLEAEPVRRRAVKIVGLVLVGCGLLVGAQALSVNSEEQSLRFDLYWLALPILMVSIFRLLMTPAQVDARRWAFQWTLVLGADVWLLGQFFVTTRPEEEIYAPTSVVRDLAARRAADAPERWRVLDRGLPDFPSTGPLGVALPMLGGVELEPALGYNTFDVRRYRQYLHFICGLDDPVRPRQSFVGYPIVEPFKIENKQLVDLLGVRYLILGPRPLLPRDKAGVGEPGTHPGWRRIAAWQGDEPVFSFLAGGMAGPGPHELYENTEVFPRAFVVPSAAPLPERDVLKALTTTDLRRTVILEGNATAMVGEGSLRAARIVDFRPNRVVVEVDDGPAGVLVLADILYPGWSCTVDGTSAPLYRANTLFRATPLTAGPHTVVFAFAPASFTRGRLVSLTSLGVVALIGIAAFFRQRRRAVSTSA